MNKSYNGKNRHIRLRHNIVRQLFDDRVISPNFVRSEVNLADHINKTTREKTSDRMKHRGE